MDNETAPAEISVPAAAAPAPAGAAPASASAAEPVAAEPVAAEPAAAYPSADTYGWDDWDGTSDALPEEVRGWHSRFDERYGTERSAYEQKVADATKTADSWKLMYNNVFDGEEDPRVAQHAGELANVTQEFATYRAEQAAREETFNAYVDKESARYFQHILGKYPDLMGRLEGTDGADDIVLNLAEGVEFEDALLIWDRGPAAVAYAQQAIKDGVGEQYVKDLVAVKFPKASEAPAPAARRQPASADLVTGSTPAAKPTVPVKRVTGPVTAQDKRLQAAMRAMAKVKSR